MTLSISLFPTVQGHHLVANTGLWFGVLYPMCDYPPAISSVCLEAVEGAKTDVRRAASQPEDLSLTAGPRRCVLIASNCAEEIDNH